MPETIVSDIYYAFKAKTPAGAAVLGNVAIATTFPGVVKGALANDTAREANYAALTAFIAWCITNGYIAYLPGGRYEIKGTATVSGSRKAGLHLPSGLVGFRTDGKDPINGTRIIQYEVNCPILTVGDISDTVSALSTGCEFQGCYLNYGVSQSGQTSAIALIFGRTWDCTFGDFTVDASPYMPYIGFQVGWNASTFFFSNRVGMIRVLGGQLSILVAKANGTGSVWNSIYLGGGGPGSRVQCTASIADFDLTGAEFGTILQFNVEWCRAGQHYPLVINKALLLDIPLMHCEGAKPYGFDTTVITSSFGAVTIAALSVSDLYCESSASGTGGSTPAILKTDGLGSAIVVRTARLYWQGPAINAELTMATPLVFHKGTATLGENVTVEIGPTTIGGGAGAITGAISFDATLTCPARGTAGALYGFGKYVYNKARSHSEKAIIEVRNADHILYAAHRNAQPTLMQTLTADRKCILSNNHAAAGIGNVPVRLAGDIVNAHRPASSAGAFNWLIRDSADATTAASLALGTEANLMMDTTGAWDAS